MLILFAVSSLVGATSVNFLSVLPTVRQVAFLIALILLLLAGLYFIIEPKRKHRQVVLCLVLGFLGGFGWAFYQARAVLAWELSGADEGRLIEVAGKIVGIPQVMPDKGLRFDLLLTHDKAKQSPIVRLYWRNPSQSCLPGDKIHCQVKLKRPWHLANPGTGDPEKQWFIQGVRATGQLVSLISHAPERRFNLDRLRYSLNEAIAASLGDKPFVGVIQATTLGIYHGIPSDQWQIYQATGTSHAIAISGLHVSLVALMGYWVVFQVTRRSYRLTTLFPAQVYGGVAGMLVAWGYAAMAGFSVPTVRALIMIMVGMGALLSKRSIFSFQTLAIAWLLIGMVDPLAPLQMGFWLSFGSVAALIYGASHEGKGRFSRFMIPQAVAFMGVLPLCVLFFKQVALLGPLANVVILPLMNIIVVPVSLLGVLLIGFSPVAHTCFVIAHETLRCVTKILRFMADFSFSVWELGQLPLIIVVLAFLGSVILLAPAKLPGRRLGYVAFLPLLLYHPPALQRGEYRFTLLDVGQGLCAVIETRHHCLLYDAGPPGASVLVPFLRAQHIAKLNKVVISHGDLDHRGGLLSLKDWPIEEIVTAEPERLDRFAKPCQPGDQWEWEGVHFQFLPSQAGRDQKSQKSKKSKKSNDRSCVLKVSNGIHSVLLTGDIEKAGEAALLVADSAALKSSILVVPHHGSLSSSSDAFVEKVAPRYALYPVGLGNHYGFPQERVLQQYAQQGAINLNVAQTGALMFQLTESENLTPPLCWRHTDRRYWQTHRLF